jgi:hypothetical protein
MISIPSIQMITINFLFEQPRSPNINNAVEKSVLGRVHTMQILAVVTS